MVVFGTDIVAKILLLKVMIPTGLRKLTIISNEILKLQSSLTGGVGELFGYGSASLKRTIEQYLFKN